MAIDNKWTMKRNELYQKDNSALSFNNQENICETLFNQLRPFHHLSTPEDFEIIFTNDEDFRAGMIIMCICAVQFPHLRILAFQLMSNHLHIILSGSSEEAAAFFDLYRKLLSRYLDAKGRSTSLSRWEPDIRPVDSLENLRNVIAYDNRNGYVVCPYDTPFSYPWGTSNLYFSPDAKMRYYESTRHITIRQIVDIIHSRKFDNVSGLTMVDDVVSPLAFCDISTGERFFRNARHYFAKISKDLESLVAIAQGIGDKIYYTDDELFKAVQRISISKYGTSSPSTLDKKSKLELAATMHHQYNASNKQIIRILRLEESIVSSLFPSKR